MSNIDGVNKNLPAHQLKNDEKTGRGHESSKRNTLLEVGVDLTVSTNKLIIEMHLKIQIESKERFGVQAGVGALSGYEGVDLSQLQYNGKPITDLSQDEAQALIGEGGFFSVENTAQRIFDFAVGAAGDDVERLQVARDAILKGFGEAEQFFGGTLPDISYDTLDKLLEMVDEKLRGLGGSVVNVKA